MAGDLVPRPTDAHDEMVDGHYVDHLSLRYRQQYQLTCLPDAEWQRSKLEQLRYKWRYLKAVDLHWRAMQHAGDAGRAFWYWLPLGLYLVYRLARFF